MGWRERTKNYNLCVTPLIEPTISRLLVLLVTVSPMSPLAASARSQHAKVIIFIKNNKAHFIILKYQSVYYFLKIYERK